MILEKCRYTIKTIFLYFEYQAFTNKMKQAKLLWVPSPNDQTAEDMTNIRHDTC